MKVLHTEFFTLKEYIHREGIAGIKTKEDGSLNSLTNIRYLLNILLMLRFRLEPYPVPEGGLCGKNVKLVNCHTMTLGLERQISFGIRPTDQEKQILFWYAEIIENLFNECHDGLPEPNIVWFSSAYQNDLAIKLLLLRSSVIKSKWKDKDESYKTNFFDITFVDKISEVTQKHLLHGDYLVPIDERGTLSKKDYNFLIDNK